MFMYYLQHDFQTRERATGSFKIPPPKMHTLKQGRCSIKKNLAKSNTQTSHWYQHVPETEIIINEYKYIRNS